jgi:excisionase family DNA binding protein
MPGEWLSLSEIAEKLGVHPSTVRNWTDKGGMPVHRTRGGHRRFKRSEVELWMQSQQTSAPSEASLVVQNALKKTRFQISEGRLKAEDWYQKLDWEARDKYRQSGRHLMQGLIAYLSTDGAEADAEARSLGYEYATRGRRYSLSVSDATQAFLFFRNTLLDALMGIYEAALVRSPGTLNDMFRKINAFTDRILLTILETYEAFDRAQKTKK